MNDSARVPDRDQQAEGAQFDIQRIMAMIPHRYPFLMIDRVVDAVPNERATGIKNVSMNEHFFQGHFPGHPVMPGVLTTRSATWSPALIGALSGPS